MWHTRRGFALDADSGDADSGQITLRKPPVTRGLDRGTILKMDSRARRAFTRVLRHDMPAITLPGKFKTIGRCSSSSSFHDGFVKRSRLWFYKHVAANLSC
jgi:hypothetical protein